MIADKGIRKLNTGISGLDLITYGGLPEGRTTLVSGSAGSGKTILAAQFLTEGIRGSDEAGVFVTFEESPEDIRQNIASLGWTVRQWEAEDKWRFVDVSPHVEDEALIVGDYDLGALLARIEYAVNSIGATRVSLDSLSAVFSRFEDHTVIRSELLRIATALKRMGVTAVITAERDTEYGDITNHKMQEFVADNVIVLRNVLEAEKRRRTIEVLKFRGTSHQKGEHPFTIIPDEGIVVIPLSAIQLKQRSSNTRVTSGNPVLDEMCGGGFFRDSIILVSGATGAGKTLMVTEFVAGGIKAGERCLLLAFEESREQLFRNAKGWGIDFETMEREEQLKVVCNYPEVASLEDWLIEIKNIITEFKPNRIAVDSLSALERVSTIRGFREFVISLTSFIKHEEVLGIFTNTTPTLTGGTSITEAHISTLTDSIVLLRYVEIYGEMRRGLTVLKMRGSQHDKNIREFTIDEKGMHIGDQFRNITGILTGNLRHLEPGEIQRLENMFDADLSF